MTPVSSRVKLAALGPVPGAIFAGGGSGPSDIGVIELVQQLGKAVGERFVDYGIVKAAQARRPIGRGLAAAFERFVADDLAFLLAHHSLIARLPTLQRAPLDKA